MSDDNNNYFQDQDVIFSDAEDDEIAFEQEDSEANNTLLDPWKLLIVDDDSQVHSVTKLALKNFQYEDRPLTFISAYSGEEAKSIIKNQPDIAIILLDVIMETDDAGLDVVDYIRNQLNNKAVQIILRTGQPGQVPEDIVTFQYNINDYKTKTELTRQKLLTTVVTSLREFKILVQTDAARQMAEEKYQTLSNRVKNSQPDQPKPQGELQKLDIQIDKTKQAHQISEIVKTSSFQKLKKQIRQIHHKKSN